MLKIILIALIAFNIGIVGYVLGQKNPNPQPIGQTATMYCPLSQFEVAQSTDMFTEVTCQ